MDEQVTKLRHELIHIQDAHAQAIYELKERMSEALECLRLAKIALNRDPDAHSKHDIIQCELEYAIEELKGWQHG